MVLPISHAGGEVRMAVRCSALEKRAECRIGHVDIAAVADDEVHRHLERPVDVSLKTEAVIECERKPASAVRVGIAPDRGTSGKKAIRLAVGERRVSEE